MEIFVFLLISGFQLEKTFFPNGKLKKSSWLSPRLLCSYTVYRTSQGVVLRLVQQTPFSTPIVQAAICDQSCSLYVRHMSSICPVIDRINSGHIPNKYWPNTEERLKVLRTISEGVTNHQRRNKPSLSQVLPKQMASPNGLPGLAKSLPTS